MDANDPRDAMTRTSEIVSSTRERPLLRSQRADGGLVLGVVCSSEGTRLKTLSQTSPCRVFFPSVPDSAIMEAVLVNTGGGLVEGDRVSATITVGAGGRLRVESQAAEKIYRSLTEVCIVSNDARVAAGGLLIWLPRETIMFDGARLCRRLDVSVTRSSRFLAAEVVIFGRIARGERLTHGQLRDSWSIHCEGKLLWMDCLRLEGNFAAHRARRFGFGDSVGLATVLYFGGDASSLLPFAREMAARNGGCATLVSGILLVRFLSHDEAMLRAAPAALSGELARMVTGQVIRGTHES
jgi:urease accessory protein